MTKKNILFIMFDQLRFDYLSCTGHPHLHTPHLDRLANKGVHFKNCYVQSPLCGPSRMSTYTGRYLSSHGACYNNVPLKVGEMTLGDHLRPLGMDCYLLGKTHMKTDQVGMARLGLKVDSVIGARLSECGFDTIIRDDGLWAVGSDGAYDEKLSPYNQYLLQQGYGGDNPWADYANAAIDDQGSALSGWFIENSRRPANIRNEDSETPWLTRETIHFLKQEHTRPWLCHVSYIKPHWPYIVPKPYHDMYGSQHVLPVVRSKAERKDPNPVYQAFMQGKIGQCFSREEVRMKAIPAYMGLIKQCDDAMGQLFEYLESSGQMQNTMIVVTSDHGDYLGDHWLGDKSLFHDPSVKVPLIIYDPSPAADGTRGQTFDALCEAIDLSATFIEFAGGEVPDHIIEGKSLLPYLYGNSAHQGKEYVISELDFAHERVRAELGLAAKDARLFMVANHEYKLVHAEGGLPAMLFDLKNDPNEFVDLGRSESYEAVRGQMYAYLHDWTRRCAQRVTVSDQQIVEGKAQRKGVMIGVYSKDEVSEEEAAFYQSKVRKIEE